MVEINEEVLVYDIESYVQGYKPDSFKDKLRIFACYSYKTKKTYLLTDKEQVQKIIDAHKVLVGFNNVGTRQEPGYDNPILLREGIDLKYKIIIDLMKIFKERAGGMKVKEGMLKDLLMEYSLNYITKTLHLVDDSTGKKEIDYNLFRKTEWTEEERKEVVEYTKRDIEVTRKLYEWTESYFESFKPFLKEEDIKKKVYLTSSLAGFAYRAICKAMSWEDTYSKTKIIDEETIGGGYVAFPAGERFEENIWLLDYQSMYPFIMIMCNLHRRKKQNMIGIEDISKIWHGDNVWKVEGVYYADKLGGIGELLKQWFNDRMEYKKKGNSKEYSLKIILNSTFGSTDYSYYEKLYDKVASGDCTRIGRQWIKYARKVFRKEGYTVIYSDTDSLMIQDPFKDKKKILATKQKIVEYIKTTVPFPQDTFDINLEAEIKYLYFFKGDSIDEDKTDWDEDDYVNSKLKLLKKNYIYITKDNKVIIKNLGLNKKSNSGISKKIFWEYLVPKLKEGQVKFSKVYIRNLIIELLQKDIMLATMRKEVGLAEEYKNDTNLAAQISIKYGPGIHFLIPNIKNIGIGKGKKFCTLEEYTQNNMKVTDIDIETFISELDYFIMEQKNKNIFDFDIK